MHRNKYGIIKIENMKIMRFKMVYDVVTLTILFERAPKDLPHFHIGTHD